MKESSASRKAMRAITPMTMTRPTNTAPAGGWQKGVRRASGGFQEGVRCQEDFWSVSGVRRVSKTKVRPTNTVFAGGDNMLQNHFELNYESDSNFASFYSTFKNLSSCFFSS